MRSYRHRWRVYFADGTSREVNSVDEASAKRTAAAAQKLVGHTGRATRPATAHDLGHVGSDADRCPQCRKPKAVEMFAEQPRTTNAQPGCRKCAATGWICEACDEAQP